MFSLTKSPHYAALLERRGQQQPDREAENIIDTLQRVFIQGGKDIGALDKVSKESTPALRSLIKKQFPNLNKNPHTRAQIEAATAQFAGGILNPYFNKSTSMYDYANSINYISKNNENIKDLLNIVRENVELNQVEGSQGFRSYPSSEGNVGQNVGSSEAYAGKITLAARFIQPGAESMDTTIPKKVESVVQGDLFNYYAPNPEHGMYNGVFLNDEQWKKNIRFAEPLALPRPGDDQLYFNSWKLDPFYRNQQPVELELQDMLEEKVYSLYASQNQNIEPSIKDKEMKYEPIMEREQNSFLIPAATLQGDTQINPRVGTWQPYFDPNQSRSSAFMNYIGFKPSYDTWSNPNEPTRFDPIQLILPPNYSLSQIDANGEQSYYIS